MRTLFALALLCASLVAQAVELPESLVLSISFPSESATAFHVPVASGDSLKCYVGFRNMTGESSVELTWVYLRSGVGGALVVQNLPVSFQPTAVTRRAGTTDRFYVAGWIARTGVAIIEEWVVGTGAFAVTYSPSGALLTTLSPPAIQKNVVYLSRASPGIAPITGLACNPYADSLLIMPYASPREVIEIPISGAVAPCGLPECSLVSEATFPELAGAVTLLAQKHKSGVFVVAARQLPPWGDLEFGSPEDPVVVLVDSDLDGAMNSVTASTMELLFDTYAPWSYDDKFTAP